MLHIHGDLTFCGKWSGDMMSAAGTVLTSSDMRKMFGPEFVVGGICNKNTYSLDGRGRLALADMVGGVSVIFNRIKMQYGRAYDIICAQMKADDLSVNFRLHARDNETSGSYYCDARVSSNGVDLILSDVKHYGDVGFGSIDSYALRCVARHVMQSMYELDFDKLDKRAQDMILCLMYLGVLDNAFFEESLSVVRSTRGNYVETSLNMFIFRYVGLPDNKAKIRDVMAGVSLGVTA